MNLGEAVELRKKWGDKPCDHPYLTKEDSMFGQWSGDMVCMQCGRTAPRSDFDAWRTQARDQSDSGSGDAQ
jgi:hypothetical protein